MVKYDDLSGLYKDEFSLNNIRPSEDVGLLVYKKNNITVSI